MTLKRIFLPVTWAWPLELVVLLVIGYSAFFGFLCGVIHERERWSVAIGACDLPATQLDSLLIMRSPSGTIYCQPRRR